MTHRNSRNVQGGILFENILPSPSNFAYTNNNENIIDRSTSSNNNSHEGALAASTSQGRREKGTVENGNPRLEPQQERQRQESEVWVIVDEDETEPAASDGGSQTTVSAVMSFNARNLQESTANVRHGTSSPSSMEAHAPASPQAVEDSQQTRPPAVRRVSSLLEREPQSHIVFRQNVRRRSSMLHGHPKKGVVEESSSSQPSTSTATNTQTLLLPTNNNNVGSACSLPASPSHDHSRRGEFSSIAPPVIPTIGAVAIGRRRRIEFLQGFIRHVQQEIQRCSREGEREKMRILYHSPAQSRPAKRCKHAEGGDTATERATIAPSNLKELTAKMLQVDSFVQQCCVEARQVVRDAQEELADLEILEAHPSLLAAAPSSTTTSDKSKNNNNNNNNNNNMLLNFEDETNSHVPQELRCTITHELMRDPVSAADGHTYERSAIQHWMNRFTKRKKPTSPVTNLPLPSRVLVPNHNIRSFCRTYEKVLSARKRKRESDAVDER